MTNGARETLRRIGDLVEVAFKMTVQLGEESDLVLRGLYNALDNVHQAIDDIDTAPAPACQPGFTCRRGLSH